MALVFVNQADIIALKALLNHTAPEDLSVRLFTNNVTPAQTDTEASYTEAAGAGYAAKPLTASSWTFQEGTGTSVGTASYTTLTWTFTGPLTGNAIIYGYYLTQDSSGKLLWVEAAPSPFQPQANGDTFAVTLNLTANNA